MKFSCKILILFVFLFNQGFAQDNKSASAETTNVGSIPFTYSFGTDKGEEIANILGLDTINKLLAIVEKFGSKDQDSVFHWKKTTQRLPVKNIQLVLTTSDDPTLAISKEKSQSTLENEPEGADALTALLADEGGKNPQIYVFLFLDRIFYDHSFQERKDGNVRFITALAHEIYGNVTSYLKFTSEQVLTPSPMLRIDMEIKAFRASILFLENAIENMEKQKDLSEFVVKLKQSLEREYEGLASWIMEKDQLSSIGMHMNSFSIKKNATVDTMNVYSVAGKKVNIDGLYNSKSKVLNLTTLSAGTYIVHIKVKNPDEERIEKILILK